MELNQHGFLEELLGSRRETTWNSTNNSLPPEMGEFFTNGWSFDPFDDTQLLSASNPSFFPRFSAIPVPDPSLDQYSALGSEPYPFLEALTAHNNLLPTEMESSCYRNGTTPVSFTSPDWYPSVVEDEEMGVFNCAENQSLEEEGHGSSCKLEMEQSGDVSVLSMGLCGEKMVKKKSKKIDGQPSKNLMAERRRRKRLNDRLSMLRSIVPKISKMDRTSILGDTIDYMKELLEKINKLQEGAEEEELDLGSNERNLLVGNIKDMKPNESLVRNTPKFDVERRDVNTKVDICCAAKPGLLLSTVNTLEALGLEIQQCVISCFSDFSMQASCSEGGEQRSVISSEDIKQALFRNAGYGGRCL